MSDDRASPGAQIDRDAVLESVAAIKHDLAKYVAWQSANFGDDAWTGPLRDDLLRALQADLLRTRGAQPAWEIWDAFVADVALQAPELTAVAESVDVLRAVGPALKAGDRDAVAGARSSIRDAQATIRSALRDLHRRLLQEA